MRRLALLIPIVAWAAGCGDQPPPAATRTSPVVAQPEIAPMPCEAGWTYNEDKRYFKGRWRKEAVIAGPITLLWLNSHGHDDFARARSLYTKVLLEPDATTTVAVADEDRGWVRMTTRPPNDPHATDGGDRGIRFEGCPSRAEFSPVPGTGYAIAVMVDRPGCATFEITPEGAATMRRRVPFGVSCG